ncbi:hypothetical protein [Streptomyces chattanoogensis]|uniref:Uncharacterized protein n=1 Tax=Streptomyces chattanoogensis TaxID=66876 RepID=A0A0N0XZZ3_9ACTN|nr:hypothetical protein [Streptomyces chattanoogensis]KPC66727.1 hypothetical protein ADL29_00540 [Streptomyces chattanoogensis]
MADEYKVDLDRLDEVVKKLNGITNDMQCTKGKATSNTYLPHGALGSQFEEEAELRKKHEALKDYIENQILKKLESFIKDLTDKTAATHGRYQDKEQETANAMNQGRRDGAPVNMS